MPRGTWTARDERQYKHIRSSCIVRAKEHSGACSSCDRVRCERTAAATVNKLRAQQGRTKTFGRHCPRGTVPLKSDKNRCYDPSTHRRVARTP